MSERVEGFDPMFFRPCIFPILADMGYQTTLSINNGLDAGPYATGMALSVSFLSDDGTCLGTRSIGHLNPGQVIRVDTDFEMAQLGIMPEGRMLGVVHCVPDKYVGRQSISVDRGEIYAHVGASDDFIEFRQKPMGVITGVAYQMGPQNDPMFNRTRTTLIQAPKAIVEDNVDTLFALINASTSFGYTDAAILEYWLFSDKGNPIASSSITVPAWTVRFISIREVLNSSGLLDIFRSMGGRGMLVGLSSNAGVVPLSLTRNLMTGAIACDHTLPPVYYFSTWGGQVRLQANARLHEVLRERGRRSE